MAENLERIGATVMGRRMFSGGEGPWESDPVTKQGGTAYTFVTEGVGSALAQARAAAGERDVAIAGGANVVQQFLKARLLKELQIHVAPILLGDAVRLFDNLVSIASTELVCTRVIESPTGVTHIKSEVVKSP